MSKYDRRPQTLANHARILPPYHFLTFGILGLNLIVAVVDLLSGFAFRTVLATLLALALLAIFFYARLFPMAVQDRLIRLELKLRAKEVLDPELAARFDELDLDQVVALRFAGDAELGELMRWALDEKVSDRRKIKERVKDWQPDYLRC